MSDFHQTSLGDPTTLSHQRAVGEPVSDAPRAVPVSEAGSNAKVHTQALGQDAKSAANSTAASAQQTGQHISASAQQTGQQISASAQETARQTQDAAKRAQEQAGAKMNQAGQKLNQAAGQANERLHALGEQAAQHPLVQSAQETSKQQLNVLDQQVSRQRSAAQRASSFLAALETDHTFSSLRLVLLVGQVRFPQRVRG